MRAAPVRSRNAPQKTQTDGRNAQRAVRSHSHIGLSEPKRELLSHMRDVDTATVEQVLDEFFTMANSLEGMLSGGTEHVKKLLMKALDPAKAAWILNNLSMPTMETGLEAL